MAKKAIGVPLAIFGKTVRERMRVGPGSEVRWSGRVVVAGMPDGRVTRLEEMSGTEGSEQCQVIRAEGASSLAARHFPIGKCDLSRPCRALKRRNRIRG